MFSNSDGTTNIVAILAFIVIIVSLGWIFTQEPDSNVWEPYEEPVLVAAPTVEAFEAEDDDEGCVIEADLDIECANGFEFETDEFLAGAVVGGVAGKALSSKQKPKTKVIVVEKKPETKAKAKAPVIVNTNSNSGNSYTPPVRKAQSKPSRPSRKR